MNILRYNYKANYLRHDKVTHCYYVLKHEVLCTQG